MPMGQHEIGAGRVWQGPGVARAWPLQGLPPSERSTQWAEDMKEFLLNRRIRRHKSQKKKADKFVSQLRAIRVGKYGEKEEDRIGGRQRDGTGNQIRHQARSARVGSHS
jgi:hypothetical protein